MKQLITLVIALALFALDAEAQRYKVVTTVESIVPGGMGRSRIIENTDQTDSEALTTARTDGKKSEQGQIKRKQIKVDKFNETKLLNFYSMVGINFQNVASNDATITDRLNILAAEGWELVHVTSAVESDAGEPDGNGIFITRFIFKRDD
ncbi:MAG: hypothetical protein KJP00_14215 [Bacteroidia bacterium]|nr:hypothetical protein [Bacteroidia bacterium]